MSATVNAEIINVLGVKSKSSVNFDAMIRRGFSIEVFDRFKRQFHVDEKTLAHSIGMSSKMLQKKKCDRRKLSIAESNMLFRVIRIFAMAKEIFGGDKKVAAEWMQELQFGLGDKTPLEMLETDAGTEKVESLLMHLQFGGVA